MKFRTNNQFFIDFSIIYHFIFVLFLDMSIFFTIMFVDNAVNISKVCYHMQRLSEKNSVLAGYEFLAVDE